MSPCGSALAGTEDAAPDPLPAPDEATPLWAQFSHERSAPPVASEAPAPEAPPALRTDASLDALELAVLGASDADRRAWYTDALFSGNAADYETTLRELDDARTWTEATDIIARDVFRKHSVNIYSDPAVDVHRRGGSPDGAAVSGSVRLELAWRRSPRGRLGGYLPVRPHRPHEHVHRHDFHQRSGPTSRPLR